MDKRGGLECVRERVCVWGGAAGWGGGGGGGGGGGVGVGDNFGIRLDAYIHHSMLCQRGRSELWSLKILIIELHKLLYGDP